MINRGKICIIIPCRKKKVSILQIYIKLTQKQVLNNNQICNIDGLDALENSMYNVFKN